MLVLFHQYLSAIDHRVPRRPSPRRSGVATWLMIDPSGIL
jgi:hypothetical protein